MNEFVGADIAVVRDPLIEEYAEVNNIMYKTAKIEMIGGGYTPIKKEGTPVKGSIHKTKKQVKSIYDANNKRNNDLLSVTKVTGLLKTDLHGLVTEESKSSDDLWTKTNPETVEDALIWVLDYQKDPSTAKKAYKRKSKK